MTFPANDPLDEPRRVLIAHLAAQAGPVVRNVRLLEELRASRQRLVAAQDEERRKIERNLHDGVQQQLVALNVQLGLFAKAADRDPVAASSLAGDLQQRATDALDDLRDLARGIYPPLLADKGLVAALEAQARKAAVPTTVTADTVERYDQAIESTVYFCTLEALNNTAKYAGAAHASIALEHTDGYLSFKVTDDGQGFDAGKAGTVQSEGGFGLFSIRERVKSYGGEIRIKSEPGIGSEVTVRLPKKMESKAVSRKTRNGRGS